MRNALLISILCLFLIPSAGQAQSTPRMQELQSTDLDSVDIQALENECFRRLTPLKQPVYSSDPKDRIRADEARIQIDNCGFSQATMFYEAAEMHRQRHPGATAPWMWIQLFDKDKNRLTESKSVNIATVSDCGGYESHEERVSDLFEASAWESAVYFKMRLGFADETGC